MKTSFVIYCRSVGLYALLTTPALLDPPFYVLSLVIVLIFGWISWFAFGTFYFIIVGLPYDFASKLAAIFVAVVVAVAITYFILGGTKGDLWHSELGLFPLAAVISGWVSSCWSAGTIRRDVEDRKKENGGESSE